MRPAGADRFPPGGAPGAGAGAGGAGRTQAPTTTIIGQLPAHPAGAGHGRDGRRAATCPPWSPARAAPARNWSPACCTSAAPRRSKPFVVVNCGALDRDVDRGRAVRARAGRLHRCGPQAGRALQGRRRRHHLPGRDRRAAAVGAGQAAARAAGGHLRAAGHQHQREGGRARDLRHAPRPQAPDGRATCFARICSTGSTSSRSSCRRCAIGWTTCRCCSTTSWSASPPRAGCRRSAPAAWAAFTRYPYPGNVREFSHAVEHACILSAGGTIDLHHLPPAAGPRRAATRRPRRRLRCRPCGPCRWPSRTSSAST